MSLAAAATKSTLIGAFCVATAQFVWGINEVLTKALQLKVAVFYVIQSAALTVVSLVWWHFRSTSKANHIYGDTIPQRINIWTRGAIQSTAFFFFYACLRLPLGDMQCIFYQAPLWTMILSYLIFNDRVPPWSILLPSGVCVIAGVVMVSQPGFVFGGLAEPLPIDGVIAILIMCVRWTASILLVKCAKNDSIHYVQYAFSSGVVSLLIASPLLFIANVFLVHNDYIGSIDDLYQNVNAWDISIPAVTGILAFVASSLNVVGYQYGDAPMVSWLEYVNIPMSFFWQTVYFKDSPNILELVGAILVLNGSLLSTIQQMSVYMRNKFRYEAVAAESAEE